MWLYKTLQTYLGRHTSAFTPTRIKSNDIFQEFSHHCFSFSLMNIEASIKAMDILKNLISRAAKNVLIFDPR